MGGTVEVSHILYSDVTQEEMTFENGQITDCLNRPATHKYCVQSRCAELVSPIKQLGIWLLLEACICSKVA